MRVPSMCARLRCSHDAAVNFDPSCEFAQLSCSTRSRVVNLGRDKMPGSQPRSISPLRCSCWNSPTIFMLGIGYALFGCRSDLALISRKNLILTGKGSLLKNLFQIMCPCDVTGLNTDCNSNNIQLPAKLNHQLQLLVTKNTIILNYNSK